MMSTVSAQAHSLASLALDALRAHPYAFLLALTPLLIIILHRLCHPNIIPGDAHTIIFLFSDAKYPQPYASTLSPFAHLRARLDWSIHALKRGHTPAGLARQVRKDHAIDWMNGERPRKGDLINAWDRVFEWNDDCIDMAGLESMRNLGDPLSEKVLASFAKQEKTSDTPQDTMDRIAQHMLHSPSSEVDDVKEFWNAVDRRPPPGCGALSLDWYREHGLLSAQDAEHFGHCKADRALVNDVAWSPAMEEEHEGMLQPHHRRLIKEQEAIVLQRGRDAFNRFGPNMHIGLLLVGLAGGFASPRITDVLKATGYLVAPKKANKQADEEDAFLLQRLNEYVEKGRSELNKRNGGPGSSPTLGPDRPHSLNLPSDATSERTFRRLLETITFVLDLMESTDSLNVPSAAVNKKEASDVQDGTSPLQKGGKGWLACCRVRFLHTAVRRRMSLQGSSDAARQGVVINQEDLMATLCAFTVAPIWALQRLGLSPTMAEREDMVAFWRHVGFYMGIEPRLLRRHFRDVQAAERTFCCISSHHFLPFAGLTDSSTPAPPSVPMSFGPRWARQLRLGKNRGEGTGEWSRMARLAESARRFDFSQGPALPLLWATAERPPGNMPFPTLCSTARFLLGPGLANATSLPRSTRWQYVNMRIRMCVLAFPVLFGLYYPRKRWSRELSSNWTELVRRIVVWCSASKRTTFGTSKDGSHDDTYNDYVLHADDGKRIVRQYRRLMLEMVAVSAFCGLVCLSALAYTYILAARFLSSSY